MPIAAELIWGLPGDNLADFERNLDQLLSSFPNINIFGYTLLPGTEFYQRRQEYRIEAIPVAGYGSRFLPATKSMPKEMLPIVNKPLVQYGVEEAIEAAWLALKAAFSTARKAIGTMPPTK